MEANDITGHDDYILGKALYRFIQQQDQKSTDEIERSDLQDAKDILLAKFPGIATVMIESDRVAGIKPANLTDGKARSLWLESTTAIRRA